MSLESGSWECVCCRISGYLVDYEVYRSNCNRWKAQSAIDECVALFRGQGQERAEERARQAEAQASQLGLSPHACPLFKRICLSPGITQSQLQRGAHLPRSKFHAALRELRTRGLIRCEYSPSTAGRKRKSFFIVTA
jgi:hypothetical protein